MMNPVTIGILVVVVALAVLVLRRRNTPPTDFSDPEKIVGEAEILITYGRNDEALRLLEKAAGLHPDNSRLIAKLNELRNENS